MTQYEVTFERVGRNHAVPPLLVNADYEAALSAQILAYVAPMLSSNDVDVAITGFHQGVIFGGMNIAGRFDFKEVKND